jgi:hypothetical protein
MDWQIWKGQDLEEKVRFATSECLNILESPNTLDGRRRNLI